MSTATLVIVNATVITLNSKQPKSEAVAIQNEKIIAVGSDKEIRKYVGKGTRIFDANGGTVIPGFVDCHAHMTGYGLFLQSLDLRNVESIKELQQQLKDYAKRRPEKKWILGGRWDQEKFAEKRYPTCWDLDKVVADKPVFLTRVCGHVGVASSKALELANVTEQTSTKGGKIDFDEVTGEPSGILRENALELIWRVIPEATLDELQDACFLACRKAVEAGLTGVHWIVDSADEFRVIQKLYANGKLPLRVYLGIPVGVLDEIIRLGLLTGFGNNMVKIGFIKILADGSLGARTAALKNHYSDKPQTKGMMLYSQKRLDKLVSKAHKAGLQLAVHAIGDRAIDSVLKALSKALKETQRQGHRHRIEHCSVLSTKLIRSMKLLGLIASVQPHFIASDFWIVDRLGKARSRWVYPFKTLIREGVIVASGSDCPVEPINPLLGIWASTARKNPAQENLTLEEALRTYTVNAAYASFDENKKGTIDAGKLADVTMLSRDLFDISPDDIRNVIVKMTIVDGQVVYTSENSQN
jgi:hypothetical protein